MSLGPFEECADDLAPGDRSVADADWSEFTLERVRSVDHPLFERAYARLWEEFGAAGEMERREVIASRLAWDPRRAIASPPPPPRATAAVMPAQAHAFLYELLVVRRGDELVAVRDHTAVVPLGAARDGATGRAAATGNTDSAAQAETSAAPGRAARVVVHLSHVLVEPSMRGSGLAGWLRALPLHAARECAAAASMHAPGAITLVAEMEHADAAVPATMARLRSYARAGFRVVDPGRTPYHQPDFRSAAEIDRTRVEAIPLALVLRRVGRESETGLGGDELRDLVAALYAMFAEHVRADHMAPVRALLERFPGPRDEVALLSPLLAIASLPCVREGEAR
ncbi:MAG: hypothetical protein HY899_18780 [Deltaproteobacteria bacterium]|nr:hypothetical protein [Deltaproteobacteria bacterium]